MFCQCFEELQWAKIYAIVFSQQVYTAFNTLFIRILAETHGILCLRRGEMPPRIYEVFTGDKKGLYVPLPLCMKIASYSDILIMQRPS